MRFMFRFMFETAQRFPMRLHAVVSDGAPSALEVGFALWRVFTCPVQSMLKRRCTALSGRVKWSMELVNVAVHDGDHGRRNVERGLQDF